MTTVTIGGHSLEISRPDKVLFPDAGITKADLVDYYRRVADVMLPHVRGRAVAMQRFPDGINESGFLHKEAPQPIVYLAEQACITPHVWLSRVDRPNLPDRLIFDLDPGAGNPGKALSAYGATACWA